MKLGFVSAILPDYTLEQVFRFARDAGFSSVELMCWPPGKAERRYAGVTHIDTTDLSLDAIEKVLDRWFHHGGVTIRHRSFAPGWGVGVTGFAALDSRTDPVVLRSARLSDRFGVSVLYQRPPPRPGRSRR